jgi:hypothetical protein
MWGLDAKTGIVFKETDYAIQATIVTLLNIIMYLFSSNYLYPQIHVERKLHLMPLYFVYKET